MRARFGSNNCSTCHGSNGQGGNGGGMPAFKGTLSDAQIKSVAAYVVKRITRGK